MIATIITEMMIASRGDGMIENRGIRETNEILIDIGTAVLPKIEDHEKERIMPTDNLYGRFRGHLYFVSMSVKRYYATTAASVQGPSATFVIGFQL